MSDHFDGKKFFNPHHRETHGFVDFVKMMFHYKPQTWPTGVVNEHQPKLDQVLGPSQLALTFVNHSSFLLQLGDRTILTDPVWSKRVSPFTWIGPKRARPPGVDFEKLPRVDVVLVSHNHYDHMDIETLRKLAKRDSPQFFVPLGDRKFLESEGIKNVTEMDWWESAEPLKEVKVTFVPAQHFSSRGLLDRNESLWGGFVIEKGKQRVYFAGDTGYSPHFKEIRARLGAPTLSLIPIGAYEPRWFMGPVHTNPDDAVKAHLDLESKQSVGIHFGTFQLTEEAIDQPQMDLLKSLEARGVAKEVFVTLGEGETRVFDTKEVR